MIEPSLREQTALSMQVSLDVISSEVKAGVKIKVTRDKVMNSQRIVVSRLLSDLLAIDAIYVICNAEGLA
jgi:hypothetical protein